MDSPKEKREKILQALDEFLDASYEQVAESEARLLGILEASPTGTLMIDKNGTIQFINPALVRFFGYSEAELIGQKVEILLPEETRVKHPELRNGFFQSPTMREMGGNRNLMGRRKDGSTFAVEIGLNPVKQKDGIYALATITDISERMNFINDLEEANKKLESTNEELENFAYRSSHDLKAPLAAISSLCNLAKMNVEEGKYDELTEILTHVETSSQRLSNLVKDILDLSRANYMQNVKDEVELTQVILGVKNNLQYYLEQNPVRIIEDYQFNDAFVSEPTRVHQIIENLISNAVKYSDQSKEDAYVKLSSVSKGNELILEVSDNGIGIDEEQIDKIFDMFYRAHQSVENSSGLGLYIVKRHVEKLNGQIDCHSEVGKGTVFTIKLPLLQKK